MLLSRCCSVGASGRKKCIHRFLGTGFIFGNVMSARKKEGRVLCGFESDLFRAPSPDAFLLIVCMIIEVGPTREKLDDGGGCCENRRSVANLATAEFLI